MPTAERKPAGNRPVKDRAEKLALHDVRCRRAYAPPSESSAFRVQRRLLTRAARNYCRSSNQSRMGLNTRSRAWFDTNMSACAMGTSSRRLEVEPICA